MLKLHIWILGMCRNVYIENRLLGFIASDIFGKKKDYVYLEKINK